MQIALYQPDIPQNVGSIIRLTAYMGVACHIIEPCGFVLDDRRIARVAMDYAELAQVQRHISWDAFQSAARQQGSRIVLLSTKAATHYCDFTYRADDILLFGRESAGVPQEVQDAADARLRIPMAPGARSLNVALTASMVLGEGLRQQNHLVK